MNHRAWAITQVPFFRAEDTIYWFLTGKKEWDVDTAMDLQKRFNIYQGEDNVLLPSRW